MKIVSFSLLLLLFGFTVLAQENKIDVKGRKQGYWKKYLPNTKVLDYEGFFKDDVPEGEFIYYFRNGKIKAKMLFKNFGKICYSTLYHEDENNLPMASGKYINQLKDSIWTYWGPSGKISMLETYKLGLLDGKKIIYYVPELSDDKSVIIAQDLFYKNGLREGEQKEYFNNGVLRCKFFCVKDLIEGEVVSNAPSGIIEMKDNYVHGVKEGWCYAYDINGLEISKLYFNKGIRLDEKQTKIYLEKLHKNKK